jgi:hypothetical protein
MDDLKSRLSHLKSPIVLVGAIILLGAVAWGIGWAAHALFDRPAAPAPTVTMETMETVETMEPTALPVTTLTPTAQAPTIPSPATPAGTPPTSTPAPSPTPSPAKPAGEEKWEIVQPGEGLYMVCRRHCPARWPPDDADLEEYAREVAWLNGLSWPEPALSPGQRIRMPSCP